MDHFIINIYLLFIVNIFNIMIIVSILYTLIEMRSFIFIFRF